MCGNRFSFQNGNAAPVEVRYEVVGSSEGATLRLPGRVAGTEYASGSIWTVTRGTVRFTYQGTVIQTVANHDQACPTSRME